MRKTLEVDRVRLRVHLPLPPKECATTTRRESDIFLTVPLQRRQGPTHCYQTLSPLVATRVALIYLKAQSSRYSSQETPAVLAVDSAKFKSS